MALLSVDNLHVYFHTRDGVVRAVNGLSLEIAPGETIGIVGESGSGKSVSMMSLLGLVPMPPGRVESGRAIFNGVDLLTCSRRVLRGFRGKQIAMIFQDPMTALNPYITVGRQLIEPLLIHEGLSTSDAWNRGEAMLRQVGIQDAAKRMKAFPHQFSGGMRQRVMIAMALITRPQLLIADEPTTALDVTVQAQILELIRGLQREMGMAVLLITHDLGVVAGTCDRVLVMYAGGLVETASTAALFEHPRHPYTTALMASLPAVRSKNTPLYSIPGLPPDPSVQYQGCPFKPRCAFGVAECETGFAGLERVADGHVSACLRVQRGDIAGNEALDVSHECVS
ncbi:MAG: ABC transporter ATP-binding protein [Candidatus Hydrogenedentota bacterium]